MNLSCICFPSHIELMVNGHLHAYVRPKLNASERSTREENVFYLLSLKVREAASETLSGLIHYGFFKVDKNLQVRMIM